MRDLVEIILWVLSNFINVFKIIFNIYTVLLLYINTTMHIVDNYTYIYILSISTYNIEYIRQNFNKNHLFRIVEKLSDLLDKEKILGLELVVVLEAYFHTKFVDLIYLHL